jgi:hypothetical protein
MNKTLLGLPFLIAATAPAQATSSMVCRTADPSPVEVSIVIGNTVGSPLVSGRLLDGGRSVEVRAVQWWLDALELRLLLIDPDATRQEALIEAKKNGLFYDGRLVRAARSRWVRCREA